MKIVYCAGAVHQNADGLSCLPTVNLLSPESKQLFELIKQKKDWSNEVKLIQGILKKFILDTYIKNNVLYKNIGGKYYIFVCLLDQNEQYY